MVHKYKVVSGVLALIFWFAWFAVWTYFADGRESKLHANGPYVYPLDTHGSIVYITHFERQFLYGLMIAGATFFILTAVIHFAGRRR